MRKIKIPTKRLGIYKLRTMSTEGLVNKGRSEGYTNLEIGFQLNALATKLKNRNPYLSHKARKAARIAFRRHKRGS